MKKILVIGSLNMDLVTYIPYLPKDGETISSTNFLKNPGGKGANQAVAASKLGGNVTMIGNLGNDEYGRILFDNLNKEGVSTKGIRQKGTTGMAFINVSQKGENNIVLVAGANNEFTKSDVESMKGIIEDNDIILLQLEIPVDIVIHVIKIAFKMNKKIILNPAPYKELPTEVLRKIHTIILNEVELECLIKMPVTQKEEIVKATAKVKELGVQRVIVTLGAKGSYLINGNEEIFIPANSVEAIDTTGAGDSYIAAFTVGLTYNMTDKEAAEFASRTAAIVVTREGAQKSMPSLKEVERFELT